MAFQLSLDFLTATEASPIELIRLARDNDLEWVALPVFHEPDGPDWNLIGDTRARRDTIGALADHGVKLDVIESFYIRPGTVVADFEAAMESGVALGAKRIAMIHQVDDEPLLLQKAGEFCEMAARYGLKPILEYTPRMTQKTFGAALEFVRKLGRPELTIEADSLHTVRSGTPIRDLAENAASISRAQLCDGPASIEPAQGRYEAISERMIPGEGDLPLVEFVKALPKDIVVGIEVPMNSRRDAGQPASRRIRDAVAGTRRVLSQA